MKTSRKLFTYSLAVLLVAAGSWMLGMATGPVWSQTDEAGHQEDSHDVPPPAVAAVELPGGLASARDGYTFTPLNTVFPAGSQQNFSFRINRSDGSAVTSFEVAHEKQLHLIAVRRDTAGFQHVHPEMAPDGTWTTQLDLSQPGSYRIFADFLPTGGQELTLGVDFSVSGDFQPKQYPPSRVATVDGYEVELTGDLVAGSSAKLATTITKDGKPLTDLQPYLGAYGHLVALRQGDLAYLHVHPEGAPGDGITSPGPEVVFYAEVPSMGSYRLFLDFQHEGKVRTAEFTVSTIDSGLIPASPTPTSGGDSHGGH